MRPLVVVHACLVASCLAASVALAQTQLQPPVTPLPPPPGPPSAPSGPLQILPPTLSPDLRIVWEVKNRFRLFRREADFLRQVAAHSLRSVLGAEQLMAGETDGRGWARAMLGNLCVDPMGAVL